MENFRRFRRLTPYLWPSKSRTLQVFVVICILLVLISRFINLAVPWLLAELVSIFEHNQQNERSFWPYLLAYVGVQFLRDGGINLVRQTLWDRVEQYSEREMGLLTYKHLLNLSYGFHANRKTGEVLSAIDRGKEVNRTLETVLFTFIPNIIDLFASIFVITYRLDWTVAVILVVEMSTYAIASSVLNKWLTKRRRDYIALADKSRTMYTDCLINYETVKYFNGEQHELDRWRETFLESQNAYMRLDVGWNLFSLVQTLITSLGLLLSSMIISHRVAQGVLSASDFVFFIMYLGQLYGPLNIIGWIYQMTNSSLINTEKLLRILNEPTEINDKPGAQDLVVTDGEIEFDNVIFSYEKSGKTDALKRVSFKVPKGSSVALVGESGAGKSTVFKLMYRFYDLPPGSGRITIDGQDIRDVTQDSLRRAIGVVPQEAVLFNGTVGYNIGYGKLGATQAEIEEAAKAAQMHERVVGFKNGYETKVGERGIRLSGGEKQRVAIARTILKSPPVLLLDEATSALDTSTEKVIQKALRSLVKGRTSISIAHRLSTIASADIILVFKNGEIVERGNHKELLKLDGVFASMWAEQIHAAEAEVEVKDEEKAEAEGKDEETIE
ncbi:P-loop containing nucleoside triphosphate hydrolase protein [Stereum hirsutum FP-91666 SS1]|uniref:P-loop containing nucleoside triphosphate hydrolase protein n=1 Tax=Stereum hirsutum (strain FP-91666) TaxID=721885 RepID=UPI0004449B46|nr:P-loop containing nucleoside triphosphate hydrolase protein [Stereum hirsutum FP-91666 SS1]EIM83057.1 P-loop containing nucleoside triphosphate hydrolase protein [Stereum hirsutum FP-91666 SS1]